MDGTSRLGDIADQTPRALQREDIPMTICTHLDHVHVTQLPEEVEGCPACLAIGSPWLHLRICLECSEVGCCDDSPNRHARAHAKGTGHPLIRSLKPGEDWSWCFPDQVVLLIPEVMGTTRIPRFRSDSQRYLARSGLPRAAGSRRSSPTWVLQQGPHGRPLRRMKGAGALLHRGAGCIPGTALALTSDLGEETHEHLP